MDKQFQEDASFSSGGMSLQNKKAAFILAGLFLLLAILISSAAFVPVYSNSSYLLIKTGQLLAFLIAGIVYTLLLHRHVFTSVANNLSGSWLYTFLLTVVIGAAVVTIYFINGNPLIMALAGSSAFILPFIISQLWRFYSDAADDIEQAQEASMPVNAIKKEIKAKRTKNNRKIEPAKYYEDKFMREQEEIKLKQKRGAELKQELEEMRKKQQEASENKIRKELEEKIRNERESFENDLKKVQEEIRQKEKENYENKLKQELEEISRKQEEVFQNKLNQEQEEFTRAEKITFENNLKKVQEEIRQKEKENYENKLKQELEEISRKQEEVFQNKLNQQQQEFTRTEKITFENDLKKEQEEIRQKEKENYENKLKQELEEISRKQEEVFQNKLNQQQQEFTRTEKITFENDLKKVQEEIRQKEKENYENKLKQELEAINRKQEEVYQNKLNQQQEEFTRTEKITFENDLKKEQEEIRQKEKEIYENKLRQELEEIRKEKEFYKIQLKQEQEKFLQQKSIPEKEEKIKKATGLTEETNDLEVKETVSAVNENEQHQTEEVERGYNNENEKIWFYTNSNTVQSPVIFINSVTLYVQLSLKNGGTEENQFTAQAPLEMKLGDFFKHFIDKKTKNRKPDMVIFNDEQKSYGWKFYTKGILQISKRELDPALSLRKNRIKETSIIIARRVQ